MSCYRDWSSDVCSSDLEPASNRAHSSKWDGSDCQEFGCQETDREYTCPDCSDRGASTGNRRSVSAGPGYRGFARNLQPSGLRSVQSPGTGPDCPAVLLRN